jgi:hypothetical protein
MNQPCFQFGRNNFGFTSKKEVYENLYLQAIIDSYQHIDKTIPIRENRKRQDRENDIRDRFYWDLTNRNILTKNLVDEDVLKIDFESWKMISESEKRRVDLVFFMSYFGSFEIECKLLFQEPSKNKPYLNNGLIRFIELKYAQNNECAGMMGFVVSGDIEKIQNEITKETEKFHPTDSKQQDCQLNWKNSFISHHRKINNSDIQIYHLLFIFTEQKIVDE